MKDLHDLPSDAGDPLLSLHKFRYHPLPPRPDGSVVFLIAGESFINIFP
jgi:hypothetical protein